MDDYKFSPYPGVTYDRGIKGERKWRSRIRCNGSLISIGRYATEIEARDAYNKKLLELNDQMSFRSLVARKGSTVEKSKKLAASRMGDKNPTKREDVKNSISNSLVSSWNNGVYDNRINGSFIDQNGYKKGFIKYIKMFQSIETCYYCKKPNARMIHHIDEDHDNWLLTNLVPVCDECHQYLHRWGKTPFETVSKTFRFSASHHLGNYVGKCFNNEGRNHGHTYELTIYIRKRVSWIDGMVVDFNELKSVFSEYIDSRIDHTDINAVTGMSQTSSENILLWIWKVLEEEALLKGITKLKLKEGVDSSAVVTYSDMLEWRYSVADWIPKTIKELESEK